MKKILLIIIVLKSFASNSQMPWLYKGKWSTTKDTSYFDGCNRVICKGGECMTTLLFCNTAPLIYEGDIRDEEWTEDTLPTECYYDFGYSTSNSLKPKITKWYDFYGQATCDSNLDIYLDSGYTVPINFLNGPTMFGGYHAQRKFEQKIVKADSTGYLDSTRTYWGTLQFKDGQQADSTHLDPGIVDGIASPAWQIEFKKQKHYNGRNIKSKP